MNLIRTVVGIVALLVVLLVGAYLSGVFFMVPETHAVVVKRFGDVQRVIVPGFYNGPRAESGADQQTQYMKKNYGETSTVQVQYGAGLYYKAPFVDNLFYFDARILNWDGERKEISTQDLRTLLVDSSARWRILDPVKFYLTLGASIPQAQSRIDGVINSQIEDEVSNTRLIEVVRSENLKLQEKVKKRLRTVSQEEAKATEIRYGRNELVNSIETQVNQELRSRFGIKLVDLMLTQLNYPDSVRKQVYDRMISERKRIAKRYRAQGERARRKILGEVQRRKDELLSEAKRRVQEILGEAEARSIQIHARAHQKNPDFYRFQRSLQVYRNSLDTGAVMVLSDDNQLLEFTTSTP